MIVWNEGQSRGRVGNERTAKGPALGCSNLGGGLVKRRVLTTPAHPKSGYLEHEPWILEVHWVVLGRPS